MKYLLLLAVLLCGCTEKEYVRVPYPVYINSENIGDAGVFVAVEDISFGTACRINWQTRTIYIVQPESTNASHYRTTPDTDWFTIEGYADTTDFLDVLENLQYPMENDTTPIPQDVIDAITE